MSVEAETLVPTMLDSEPIAADHGAPRPEPVAANERVAAVDVLRGFRAPGHPGHEYRRVRMAGRGVRQPDARRRFQPGSIASSGCSIISSLR